MNPLKQYFEKNQGNQIHKWTHYFDIYETHFQKFRNSRVKVLEIGVGRGGALEMWREYFGPESEIVGLDNRPACKRFEGNGISVAIGDQADKDFMMKLSDLVGGFDIVIDDGGHRMEQQIASFVALYPGVSPNGVYLCEDTQTSYKRRYGGGLREPTSFIEFSKNLIDELHGWHFNKASEFTKMTSSIHFYDGVVVFQKGNHFRTSQKKTGVVRKK